jgi:RNA polymerase sigma-70 factor (ECF subfamily)
LDHDEAVRLFYATLWPHRQGVLRVARLLCRQDAEADDLAQETMLKAFKGIGSFRPGTDAKAWLLQILRNARVDRVRKSVSEGSPVSLDDVGGDEAVATANDGSPSGQSAGEMSEQELLERFSDQDIIDALKTLPEEIRMTLLLVDVERVDQKDAAEILGVPVGTIKSRCFRGRAMMRERLAARVGQNSRSV